MDAIRTPAKHVTENRHHDEDAGHHLRRTGAIVNALAEHRLAAARDQRATDGECHRQCSGAQNDQRHLPRRWEDARVGGESVQIEGAAVEAYRCRH